LSGFFRKAKLEEYLRQICLMPILANSADLELFLEKDHVETEKHSDGEDVPNTIEESPGTVRIKRFENTRRAR
jgi:hypothetical protein